MQNYRPTYFETQNKIALKKANQIKKEIKQNEKWNLYQDGLILL